MPLFIVIGPGFLCDLYPFQPPSLAIIHFAHIKDFCLQGFDNSLVLPYALLSAVLGWWGIPWEPIYTVQSIASNIKGGKDVTQQVLASLITKAITQNVMEALTR